MLREEFFKVDGDTSVILQDILSNIHSNGAISLCELETLSLLKYLNNKNFIKYEPHIIYAMGLFYKTSQPQTFLDLVYDVYAKSINEKYGVSFTPVQADIFRLIQNNSNFSFSAPTSTGKSFLFRTILSSTNGDIIIVVPSRALLAEYLIRIRDYAPKETLVLPFIEVVNKKRTTKRIYVVTPERSNELFKHLSELDIKLVLFDEAQISEEGIRGMRFDSFVRRVTKKLPSTTKVFAHPFVNNPEAQLEKHNITVSENYMSYKQNNVGKLFLSQKDGTFTFFSPYDDKTKGTLTSDIDPLVAALRVNKTCLIYISKSSIYDRSFLEIYNKYINLCSPIDNEESLKLINELEAYLGVDSKHISITIQMLKRGIVLHHGSMPLKARYILEKFVNKKHARICFATSTLIQGINMPFDIVWIRNFLFNGSDNTKILSIKNLIGRAGRSTDIKGQFDFGTVIIDKKNKDTFCNRLNVDAVISNKSLLDDSSDNYSIDYKDNVESIQNDTFSDDYNIPQVQVERLDSKDTYKYIAFILDSLLPDGRIISAKDYYGKDNKERKKIKEAFKKIYTKHLRRDKLEVGEQSVLSAAIPILLWQIQGRSFAEIVMLRYSYLSCKSQRQKFKRMLKEYEISEFEYNNLVAELKIPFSTPANQLPNMNLKSAPSLFSRTLRVDNIDFDTVIYDTYDYIDKVISFSLKDPLCAAFQLYYNQHNDERALALSNYIQYGTNNEKEIWLLKYGFVFEEIEWVLPCVDDINSEEIVFNNKIKLLDANQYESIIRYL